MDDAPLILFEFGYSENVYSQAWSERSMHVCQWHSEIGCAALVRVCGSGVLETRQSREQVRR